MASEDCRKGDEMNDWMGFEQEEIARRAEWKAIIVGVCVLGVLAIVVLAALGVFGAVTP